MVANLVNPNGLGLHSSVFCFNKAPYGAFWEGVLPPTSGFALDFKNNTVATPTGGKAWTLVYRLMPGGSALDYEYTYVWVEGTRPGTSTAPTLDVLGLFQRESADPNRNQVLYINNLGGVGNGGRSPSFTIENPTKIYYVMTYHYNGGRGAPPGFIAFRSSDGRVYGPYRASLAANFYWIATPNVVLAPGRYQLRDSDAATWSQNSESGGFGMTLVKGLR